MATVNFGDAETIRRESLSIKTFFNGEILGQGTYGCVVASEDPKTHSPVALKTANTGRAIFKDQLRLESRMLQEAMHPHVVGLRETYSLGPEDLTLVLDRVAPDAYKTFFQKRDSLTGSMTGYQTITVAKQLLEALAPFHDKGFIHRDVRADNISYDTKTNQLKLLDFGLAIHYTNIKPRDKIQNSYYRAPEIFKHELYDNRVDIWSVGCILFELYTGRPLFTRRENSDEVYLQNIYELTSSSPEDPPKWQKWIHEASAAKQLSLEKAHLEAATLIALIAPMLEIDPKIRIGAKAALALPSLNSDINFTIQTNKFGPFFFHLFEDTEDQEGIDSSAHRPPSSSRSDLGYSNRSVSFYLPGSPLPNMGQPMQEAAPLENLNPPSSKAALQVKTSIEFSFKREPSMITSPSVHQTPIASPKPAAFKMPILSLDLARPTNLQKNACLHAPATSTNRYVAEIVDKQGQVVEQLKMTLENGMTIHLNLNDASSY